MIRFFVGLVLVLSSGAAWTLEASEVRTLLEQMRESDQSLRLQIRDLESKDQGQSSEVKELWKRQEAMDAENSKRLVEIVEASGWPKISEVGEPAATTAFLVLQHSDIAVQKRLLPLVRAGAEQGEVEQSSLALLEDRVLVSEGHAQIFGSQIRRDPESGKKAFFPIKDEALVDFRRKGVGLEPIAEYAKRFGLTYVPAETAN